MSASALPYNQWMGGISQALGAIPQGLLGTYQYFKANKALKQINQQPFPEYSIAPEQQEAYNEAYKMSKMGYTPQEKGAFKQNVAQSQNTAYRQGLNMAGGNLAQALSTGLAAQNLGAMNRFAEGDASLRRQNIRNWQSVAGQMQGQRNLMDQQKIARRTALEQAYGMAAQRGLQNMASASSTALSSYSGSMGNSSNAFTNSGMGGDYGQNDYQGFNWDPTQKDFKPGGDFYDSGSGSAAGVNKYYDDLWKQEQQYQLSQNPSLSKYYGSTY